MINTYKNISTDYYLAGLKPLDAAVIVGVSFFLLILWWPSSVLFLCAAYKFAKIRRRRHYGYLDIFVYLAAPERYSVERDAKNW
jgi:hypothetical protein